MLRHLSWFVYCLAVATATQCYSCGSLGGPIASCFLLHIKPSQVVVSCDESGTELVTPGCVKITYVNGDKETAWRGCANFVSVTASGGVNSCAEGVYGGKPVRYCHCSTNVCNGQSPSERGDLTRLAALAVLSRLVASWRPT